MPENAFAAGAPLQIPLGSFQSSRRLPNYWGGRYLPYSLILPPLPLSAFGLGFRPFDRASVLPSEVKFHYVPMRSYERILIQFCEGGGRTWPNNEVVGFGGDLNSVVDMASASLRPPP